MKSNLPSKVVVSGIEYSIEYCDNASDVDIFKRKSLWGQCDYWTRTIRVYDNGRSVGDIWHTIIHEVLHGIEGALKLTCFEDENGGETDDLIKLSYALADTFIRNGWLNIDKAT